MFIKMLRSQSCASGTYRCGVIYAIDEKNHLQVRDAENLLTRGFCVKTSKKELAEEQAVFRLKAKPGADDALKAAAVKAVEDKAAVDLAAAVKAAEEKAIADTAAAVKVVEEKAVAEMAAAVTSAAEKVAAEKVEPKDSAAKGDK